MSIHRTSSPPWNIFLMEAALLGLFMISACTFTFLLEHPASFFHQSLPTPDLRRALMALAMGTTALLLLKTHWAKRTGAHMNPAVTIAVLRMKRITSRDAIGYVSFQILGAIAGVAVVRLVVGMNWLAHPAVHYAATTPAHGRLIAFLAESLISFLLMFILTAVNRFPRLIPHTPFIAGILIALYIFLEAPLSGMSMNPARTLSSALFANDYSALWIYFIAPTLGMLAAVELHLLFAKNLCCKPVHDPAIPCHCPCTCLEKPATFHLERTNPHVHGI